MATAIISLNDARAQGLKRYYLGIPCPHGHLCERYVRDFKCVLCVAKRAAIRSKRWSAKNPDRAKANTDCWRAAHPDKWRESNRRSKQANQKKYTDAQRADYALNPEKYRVVERRRRARQRNSIGTHHTPADVAEILESQNNCCAYCKISFDEAKKHVDHIVPLSRGGSNGRENIQILCSLCNRRKGARDPIEYARSIGLLP